MSHVTDGMMHPLINVWGPLGGSPKANAEASLASFREACDWFNFYATESPDDQ